MRNPGSRAATLAVLVLIVLTGCGDDDQPLAPDGDTWQHDGTLLVHSQLAVEALAGVREIDGALRIVGREGEDPIVDLSPLASLQRVKELEISGTEITSLHGLEGLTEIDSLFTLQRNHLLASCAALAICGGCRPWWSAGICRWIRSRRSAASRIWSASASSTSIA